MLMPKPCSGDFKFMCNVWVSKKINDCFDLSLWILKIKKQNVLQINIALNSTLSFSVIIELWCITGDMQRHVRLAHSACCSHRCETCGASYNTVKYLLQHIARRHNGLATGATDTTPPDWHASDQVM